MTTHQNVRSALGWLYVIAILLAVFFASGMVIAAVAALGAIVVGMIDRLTAPPAPEGGRGEHRAVRRAARPNR